MSTGERTAVLLAGGLGSRLRPLTFTIPKPLLPIGEFPIIEVVLRQLSAAGFTRVVISLGHLGDMIEYWVGDGSRFGLNIEYVREHTPLGTAGALALISGLEGHFLVMNGDLLTTFEYSDFLEVGSSRNCMAAVALKKRSSPIDYGVITTSEDGKITEYREKPSINFLVSMGIYILHSSALVGLEAKPLNMPELLHGLMTAGESVLGIEFDCYWEDLGRLDDFERASRDFTEDPSRFLPSGSWHDSRSRS